MEQGQARYHSSLSWVKWAALTLVIASAIAIAFLFLAPKPLVVKGALKTKDGPVAAGAYDFRLKFYDATTRTDLIYSYDAKNVQVDEQGNFNTTLPSGNTLKVATLMQVCIASSQGATPGTVTGGTATLPSCDVGQGSEPSSAVFNQTICGLTAVDQNPTNTMSWLATKNVVYATPTKACGQSTEGVASISGDDIITPLIETPGSLGDVLDGVNLQPGSMLTVGADGQVVALPPAEAVGDTIREEITESEADNAPSEPATNVFNSYPTVVEGEANTDNQTLALSGNVLSISGGNSVDLPVTSGSDQDSVIGNEITDVIAGSGLVRVGAGTTLDPFQIGLITCANGDIIKSTGPGTWGCATDTDTTYAAGIGISFSGTTINNTGVLSLTLPAGSGLANSGSGQNPALALQDCANGEILQYNAGAWGCVVPSGASSYSFAITDTTTTQPILNGNTITFVGNEGLVATVAATDSVSYGIVNGGVSTLKLADGSVSTIKIANGAVTTVNLSDGAVTNSKLANSSLTVNAGSGLSGGGVVALGASTTLNLQACANGQILKHNGTTWACAADSGEVNTDGQTLSIVANAPDGANTISYDLSISGGNTVAFDDRDTLYSAATSGGLTLSSAAFSLQACPVGQILKSTNAGTPTYACAADENTDTNTTYTAGTGLSLVGTTFNNTGVLGVSGSGAITSSGGQNPTISFADGSVAGQFWQWDGDSWELATLAAEQDAIIGNEVTNVTGSNSGLTRSGAGTAISPYTLAANVGNGIQLTGNAIAINSPTCSGTDKLQWNGTAFICSSDVDTNTTYTSGNGLQLAGTTFSVNSPTCAGTTKLQWTGTAFVCSADVDTDTNTDAQTLSFDNGTRILTISGGNSVNIPDANTTYTAGSGLNLAGTTFSNTGVLSVTGSGAITSSGGQNPNIAFANGSITGQFWQWDGDSWELATLAAEQDAIIGNEVTNVTGSNSGLVRTGAGTAVDPYTLAISTGNGLQITSGNLAINSPTCSGTTKLQWTGTAFTCATDINTDTTNFSITDGTNLQTVSDSQAITFSGDAATKITSLVSGTRNVSFKLDTTGALNGQVLTFTGAGLAWQTPATYAPTTCSVSGTYICQNGNTLGGAVTIGTNDAQVLNFETNDANAMTILANGDVGIGTATPTQALHVDRGALKSHAQFTNNATGHTATDGFIVGLDSIGEGYVFNFDNQPFFMGTNGVVQLYIAPTTGNVGIQNTSPAVGLHVGSSSIVTGTTIARFQNAGGTCNIIPSTAGTISCTSDERLKKNIEEYNGALDAISKLDIKKYNMKTDAEGTRKQIGVMAQELEKVFPGLVSTDENGYKSVAYGGLVPVLAEAINEQQVKISELTAGLWSGGIVSKDTTFKSQAIFEGRARFTGSATFTGDVAITGKVKLSRDQVSQAVLPAGNRRVTVSFDGAYARPPHITATPREFIDGPFRVTDVRSTSFTIEVRQTQEKDVHLDWHAFANST